MDHKEDSIIEDTENDKMPGDVIRPMAVKDIMRVETADDDKHDNVVTVVNQEEDADVDWKNKDLDRERNVGEEEKITFFINDFDKSEKQLLRNSTQLIDVYPGVPREGSIHIVIEIVGH
ncbi:hypothetical protein BG011_000255, partial [Mortierella polycephala]